MWAKDEGQFKIIKRAVTKCPSVNTKIMGESKSALLDSRSMVSLISQTCFNHYFRPRLGSVKDQRQKHIIYVISKVLMKGTQLSADMSSWT